jgi:hypothetical protein
MSKVNKKSDILAKHGNLVITQNSVSCHLFEISSEYRLAQPSILPFYNHSRTLAPVKIQDFNIIPFGRHNDYPDQLREILDDNNLTPEVLNKQAQLLYGQGPGLYQTVIEEGKRLKKWVNVPDIEAWLRSWEWEDYLLKACIEFRIINGHFTKFYRDRGARIGRRSQIAKLEHVSSAFSRLEWPDDNWIVRNIIVGDFYIPWRIGLRSYPVFDPEDPFGVQVSMRYSNLYSFALDHEYSRAPWHGTIHWIKLASSIAKLLTSFNTNSAAIKYHIKSPALYWEIQKEKLMEQCREQTPVVLYTDKMLEDLKDATFLKITEALSSSKNVGKFLATEQIWDSDGNQYVGWTIEVLDQKVKDFIDAQINIAKHAQFETTSGIGLHPAISNLSMNGNLPSGAEQLYAFKLYLSTGVDIPESIVCKDINLAIRANFPGSDVKVGFYHDNILTEEATNPDDRVKNQSSYKKNIEKQEQNQPQT